MTVVAAFTVVAGAAVVLALMAVVDGAGVVVVGATAAAPATTVEAWLDGDSDGRVTTVVDAELTDFGLGFAIADPTAMTPTNAAGIMNRFRRHHGRVPLSATELNA